MTTTARVGVDITAQDRTAAAFMSATRSVQKFSSVAAAAVKGFAGGFASAALIRGLSATITRMDELTAASQRMGVGVETLSKLGYAAQLSELPFETLMQTSKKLNENLAGIGAGKGGDAASAMKALGLTAFDAAGKLKSVDQVVVDVAGKFSLYKDGANKVALATALFGKAGQDMIPMLNGGAQAIADAKAEADRFGLTLQGPAAEAASTFNDNMDRMAAMVQGASQTIVSAFLPAVNDMVDSFFRVSDSGSAAEQTITAIGWASEKTSKALRIQGFAIGSLAEYWKASLVSARWLTEGNAEQAMLAWGIATDGVAKKYDILSDKLLGLSQSSAPGKGSLPSATPAFEAPSFARGGSGSGGGSRRGSGRPSRGTPQVDSLAQDAARIMEAARTPMEAHMARVAELDKLLGKGYITQTVYNRSFAQSQNQYVSAAGALNQFTAEAEQSISPLQQVSGLLESRLTSAFDAIIDRTSSVGKAFKDMATGILQDASKMMLHSAIQGLFKPEHGLYGGGGGLFANLLGSAFGGLPSFAVGADRVPRDMVANIHKDEMIIPAAGANALRKGGVGGGGVTIIDQRNNGAPVQPQQQADGSWLITLRDMARQEAHGAIRDAMPNYGLKPMNRMR